MRGSSRCNSTPPKHVRPNVAILRVTRTFPPSLRFGAARRSVKRGGVAIFAFTVSVAAASPGVRLIQAVKDRDIESVRALLNQRTVRADVNAPQGDGASALRWAAHRDDLAIADLLIRSGARANAA